MGIPDLGAPFCSVESFRNGFGPSWGRELLASGKRCQTVGIRCSIGSVGDCYDNAMGESLFAILKSELLGRQTFQTALDVQTALFDYIEVFYNHQRRYSALDYLSPDANERRFVT